MDIDWSVRILLSSNKIHFSQQAPTKFKVFQFLGLLWYVVENDYVFMVYVMKNGVCVVIMLTKIESA